MVDLIYLNFFPSHLWASLLDQFPPTGRWRFFNSLNFSVIRRMATPPTDTPTTRHLAISLWMMNLLLLAVIIIINDSMSESLARLPSSHIDSIYGLHLTNSRSLYFFLLQHVIAGLSVDSRL
jgi:hypothetical protein